MKNPNIFFIIVISILMGIITIQTCTLKDNNTKPIVKIENKKYEIIKHKIDTVVINKIKTKYIKGSDIYHKIIVEKEIKTPVYIKNDTIRVIQEYLTKNVYKDKLVLDDSLGTIYITDTIQYNKIIGRKWDTNVRERIVYDVKIVKELPRNQVYVGIGGISNSSSILVGPNLLLKTKKDNIYGLNLYVDPNSNMYIGVNINWKIKIIKK
jgi:hypothetical protein